MLLTAQVGQNIVRKINEVKTSCLWRHFIPKLRHLLNIKFSSKDKMMAKGADFISIPFPESLMDNEEKNVSALRNKQSIKLASG